MSDRLRKLGPPPPAPGFDWNTKPEPVFGDRVMEILIPAIMVMFLATVMIAFLAIGLPKLLVAAHSAWLEVFRVWGINGP